MKHLILAILLLFPVVTVAQYKILIHAVSHHGGDKQYNEKNYTLGVELENGITIAAYKDSYNTLARYITYTKPVSRWRWGSFGVALGIVNSPAYAEKNDMKIIPLMLPVIELHPSDLIHLNLLVKPKLSTASNYVIAVQFKIVVD